MEIFEGIEGVMQKIDHFWENVINFLQGKSIWLILALLITIVVSVWGYFLFCDDNTNEDGKRKWDTTDIVKLVAVLVVSIIIGIFAAKAILFLFALMAAVIRVLLAICGQVILIILFCAALYVVYLFYYHFG